MFASWSAGEYGSVGATEWLEVSFAFLSVDTHVNPCCFANVLLVFRVTCPPLIRAFSPTSAWTESSWVSITHSCRLSLYWNILNNVPPPFTRSWELHGLGESTALQSLREHYERGKGSLLKAGLALLQAPVFFVKCRCLYSTGAGTFWI